MKIRKITYIICTSLSVVAVAVFICIPKSNECKAIGVIATPAAPLKINDIADKKKKNKIYITNNTNKEKSIAPKSLEEDNKEYVIVGDFTLQGEKMKIGKNSSLNITKGSISNGELVGDNTRLIVNKSKPTFKNLRFSGNFIIGIIKTDFFVIDNNTLKDMISLTSDEIKNEVVINHDLRVRIPDEWRGVVQLRSQTNIVLNANIHQEPTNFKGGNIFFVNDCHDVAFMGKGHLIGDVRNHQDKGGECIYGIWICNATNISVKNITCEEFWGDGIYIYPGGIKHKSNNICDRIVIDSVTCNNNRRQGLSIVGGTNIIVKNSYFTNTGAIHYTPPSAGIDVEPATEYGYDVDNLFIENCYFEKNGPSSYAGKKDLLVYGNNGKVFVSNCEFKRVILAISENVLFNNCTIDTLKTKGETVDKITIKDCQIDQMSRVLNDERALLLNTVVKKRTLPTL